MFKTRYRQRDRLHVLTSFAALIAVATLAAVASRGAAGHAAKSKPVAARTDGVGHRNHVL